MPTADDLIGYGIAPQLAGELGNAPTSLACLGTTQATAALAASKSVELIPSASNTGAILSAGSKVGSPHHFFNSQATSAVIYCPVGDVLNSVTNNSLTLAQNKAAILFKYKTVGSVSSWWSLLTA